jgi:acyl carrier protein
MSQPVPQGIEILVKKASVDPAFRNLLLERPEAAVAEIGLELGPAEAMMLRSVPREQLAAVIARTSVPEEHRRAFLGQAAAAMLAAIGMMGGRVAVAEQLLQAPGGIAPDRQPPKRAPAEDRSKPLTAEEISERVVKLIAAQLKVDKDQVKPEKSLVKDLRATSKKLIALRKALAMEFKLKITADSFKKVHTVGETITLVQKALLPPARGYSGGMRPN